MLISVQLWSIVLLMGSALAGEFYNETLTLKPLPRNKLLSTFNFDINSSPFTLQYYNSSIDKRENHHYTYFPRALGPILESTNVRELHLRFTQGWWDSDSWGKLPFNGFKSGGTGVEVWSVIEAPNIEIAKENWYKLSKTLSGFFCASINFIDDSITTFPKHAIKSYNNNNNNNRKYYSNKSNKLYLIRAALPSEPICTENLTPFLKLLPTRGKSGISSLLDGHKLFDSLWHGMSIDVYTDCENENQICKFKMNQSVNHVIDIMRSIRKGEEGAIPKPTPGEKLRCDENKTFNVWQCFPLNDPTELDWSLETLYGRLINGPAFLNDHTGTTLKVLTNRDYWRVTAKQNRKDSIVTYTLAGEENTLTEILHDQAKYDFNFKTTDSSQVLPVEIPPLLVSRSLTGYSLDKGGFRVSFKNPSDQDSIDFLYFESLPWFARLYLNTLTIKIHNSTGEFSGKELESEFIKNTYYRPAIDRSRPSHLELLISIPANSTIILTYQFDKSLLLYHEYPPDANHGFAVEPAIITVLDNQGKDIYELRTTSLLLTLPTPDFSMPYNVIIMTCTIMSLMFGSVFNLLTKKVITEEELEQISSQSKGAKIVSIIRQKLAGLKGKKTAKTTTTTTTTQTEPTKEPEPTEGTSTSVQPNSYT
ncbi:putative GPI transamidase component [Scheffersomyces amazonensis]|uniref:putative GPI transamidase component n=1 Tax=Scheffersomyces amazonensis TaxID=1078765 RepID=UPI00315D9DE6